MYDELVNALRQLSDYDLMDFLENRAYAQDIAHEAADAIEELQNSKWISVKEQLPENDNLVLVCGPKGGMSVARPYRPIWNGVFKGDPQTIWWTKATTGKSVKVAYWMPLLKPPKEEQT